MPFDGAKFSSEEYEHPPCLVCNGPVERKKSDRFVYEWKRRETCCPKCARILQIRRWSLTQGIDDSTQYKHPVCNFCKGPVERREDEKTGDWRKRKTCSPECAERARHRTTAVIHPPCLVCGGAVERHLANGEKKKELRNNWLNRKTCSVKCGNIYKTRKNANKFSGMTHDPCPVCGGPVPMREGDRPSQWQNRVTCSVECHNKRASEGARKAAKPLKDRLISRHRAKGQKRQSAKPGTYFESVEAFLARGGKIRRFDFAPPGTLSISAGFSAKTPRGDE